MDKSDRNAFDRMFSLAHLYNSASSCAAKPVRIQPTFLSIIFHDYKKLRNLSKEMNQEQAKRPKKLEEKTK